VAIAFDDGLPELGTLASVEVSALSEGEPTLFQVCVDELPPAEHLRETEEGSGLFLATYVVVAEATGEEAAPVAASFPRLLVYVDGEVPPELADSGLVAGWNDIVFGPEGLTSAVPYASGDELELEANLLIDRREGLRGVIVPDFSDAAAPVASLLSSTHLVDETAVPPVRAMIAETEVSPGASNAAIQLTPFQRPPADHLYDSPDLPYIGFGLYQALVFDDTNGSGTLELGEPVLASSFAASPARSIVYFEPRDWRASLYLTEGFPMGWGLSENDNFLDWSTGVFLDASN
jgi:hypothetical protein